MTGPAPARRSGGRDARRAARLHGHLERARLIRTADFQGHLERTPFLTRTLQPFEVLDEEGLSLIEHNADSILEEVGIVFRGDPEALQTLRDGGADIDGELVRFPRGMCRQLVQASALPTGDNAQLASQQGQGDAQRENDEKSAGIAALESAGSPQLAPDYQPVLPFLAR